MYPDVPMHKIMTNMNTAKKIFCMHPSKIFLPGQPQKQEQEPLQR